MHLMANRAIFIGFFGFLSSFGLLPGAAAEMLHYQYHEQVFEIMPLAEWKTVATVPTFRGRELSFDGDAPEGIEFAKKTIWDAGKIAKTLERKIAEHFNRERGSVIIGRNDDGTIVFDGVALPGREVDIELAALMTVKALEEGIQTIQLPVRETNPIVSVEDAGLLSLGVRELVTVGESDYSHSPPNRRHNIAVGLNKFNGRLLHRGEEFSFNTILGPVSSKSGFLEELTILGEKTLPAYGGGLCQVSTTAYRGVWRAGFPITSRRNHSYAVRYYSPPGTDATIYPPWTDMQFVNDTRGSLLIQTHHEDDKAYFLYYGTKPKNRSVELVGPFNFDHKPPPEDRTEHTTEIALGETRVVSRAVPGMKTLWYRLIEDAKGSTSTEAFLSEYEARPYFQEIGIAALPDPIFSARNDRQVIMTSGETSLSVPR
jgi:vancomycin resistance protein YoaR